MCGIAGIAEGNRRVGIDVLGGYVFSRGGDDGQNGELPAVKGEVGDDRLIGFPEGVVPFCLLDAVAPAGKPIPEFRDCGDCHLGFLARLTVL